MLRVRRLPGRGRDHGPTWIVPLSIILPPATADSIRALYVTLPGLPKQRLTLWFGWIVAVNPSVTEASALVRPGPKMIVLRPRRSKQPDGEAHQAPIEKILVDLVEESADSALMDGSEAQGLVATILNRYLVQLAGLQSYAERRGVKLKALAAIN